MASTGRSPVDGAFETPLGRYRLIALLGQGGMADVYLACRQGPGGFQKLLVIKLARFSGDAMFSTMFLDEARLSAQLNHPHIVQTYEVGEEGSRHYIVMEYLDGSNLSRLRSRARRAGKRIPLRISLQILVDTLEGLSYAHQARGIDGNPLHLVHRDLTPSNIIITSAGIAKIVDFGIAKGVDTHSFTQTGRFSGKVHYMPPEQLRGESVDHRADIFSLGVVLAESVLGERFWGETTPAMVASRLSTGDVPRLDGVVGLDPELREICERALAPDREERYANAAIFRNELNRFLNKLGGVVETDELAEFVNQYTAEDRVRLQGILDAQLQRVTPSSFRSPPTSSLPLVDFTPSSGGYPRRQTVEPVDTFASAPATVPSAADDPVIEVSRVGSLTRKTRALVVIGSAVVVAAIGLVAIRKLTHNARPEPTVAAQPMVPAVPAGPTNVRLEVIVTPPQATLELDGTPLGSNPYLGPMSRDQKIHELVVKADGYQSVTRKFTLDQDVMLQLSLAEQPKPKVIEVKKAPEPPPPPAPHVEAEPAHSKTAAKPKTKPAQPQHATTAPKPQPAAVTTPPPPPPPQPTVTTETKRRIDSDFETKPKKSKLETDVFDSSKKTAIDRDNPYNK